MLQLADGRAVPYQEQLTLSIVEDRGYRQPANRFPFNLLRNIASDGCPASTDAVLLLDANFELCVTWRKRLAIDTSTPNSPSAGPRQLSRTGYENAILAILSLLDHLCIVFTLMWPRGG